MINPKSIEYCHIKVSGILKELADSGVLSHNENAARTRVQMKELGLRDPGIVKKGRKCYFNCTEQKTKNSSLKEMGKK